MSKRGRGGATGGSRKTKLSDVKDVMEATTNRFANKNFDKNILAVAQQRVQGVIQLSDAKDLAGLAQALLPLSDEDLAQLLNTCDASTKPDKRCEHIADCIFKNEKETLEEMKKQAKMCDELLNDTVMYLLLSLFSHENGDIQWTAFMKVVTDVIKEKAQAGVGAGAYFEFPEMANPVSQLGKPPQFPSFATRQLPQFPSFATRQLPNYEGNVIVVSSSGKPSFPVSQLGKPPSFQQWQTQFPAVANPISLSGNSK